MSDNLIVTVQDTSIFTAVSNLNNPAYLESLNSIGNVDTTTNGLVNGSLLIYNTTTNKWAASNLLNSQNIEAGEF